MSNFEKKYDFSLYQKVSFYQIFSLTISTKVYFMALDLNTKSNLSLIPEINFRLVFLNFHEDILAGGPRSLSPTKLLVKKS